MTPSKEAIEAAHREIDYSWGYVDPHHSDVCLSMTEKAIKAAYAIDFAALQKENERLQARVKELEGNLNRFATRKGYS